MANAGAARSAGRLQSPRGEAVGPRVVSVLKGGEWYVPDHAQSVEGSGAGRLLQPAVSGWRDYGLGTAGGHLRAGRRHQDHGRGAGCEARGRADLARRKRPHDPRHEAASGGRADRAGASLRARLRCVRAQLHSARDVDPRGIKATYDHGVLTLTLPKVEQAKPRQIPVEVTSK